MGDMRSSLYAILVSPKYFFLKTPMPTSQMAVINDIIVGNASQVA